MAPHHQKLSKGMKMKAAITTLVLNFWLILSQPSFAADSMNFDCQLLGRAPQQGTERFVKAQFLADGSAELFIADLVSPFEKIIQAKKLKRAHYSHSSSSAGALWLDEAENNLASLNLAFFGTYWAGMVQFHQDANTASLTFKKNEEIELRCAEKKNLPLVSPRLSLN